MMSNVIITNRIANDKNWLFNKHGWGTGLWCWVHLTKQTIWTPCGPSFWWQLSSIWWQILAGKTGSCMARYLQSKCVTVSVQCVCVCICMLQRMILSKYKITHCTNQSEAQIDCHEWVGSGEPCVNHRLLNAKSKLLFSHSNNLFCIYSTFLYICLHSIWTEILLLDNKAVMFPNDRFSQGCHLFFCGGGKKFTWIWA